MSVHDTTYRASRWGISVTHLGTGPVTLLFSIFLQHAGTQKDVLHKTEATAASINVHPASSSSRNGLLPRPAKDLSPGQQLSVPWCWALHASEVQEPHGTMLLYLHHRTAPSQPVTYSWVRFFISDNHLGISSVIMTSFRLLHTGEPE